MRAMVLPEQRAPLRLEERTQPEPGPGEVLLRVRACAVCRTDLHILDGELPHPKLPLIPGHQIVGIVERGGSRWKPGTRIGVPWLAWTCGECRFCRSGRENLCDRARFTGYDVDGGYADHVVVPAAFAYRLPESVAAATLAPLLCAGIIGYRALRRADLPPGGRLGIYGFGGSGHLTTQVALAEGARVHVMTRGEDARALALELGASSAVGAYDQPPEPLDAAILFAPVGDLVPVALAALDRGGTLAVAGIHLSPIPPLDYQAHLFQERTLRSVTANTRRDGREFLAAAARIPVRTTTRIYPFEQAPEALRDLAHGAFTGAAVLEM